MRSDGETIIRILKKHYRDGGVTLNASSPFQLLVATVLSAQCTDERVNMITPVLFKRFRTPKEMGEANINELKELIRPAGFFNQKAKFIRGLSRILNDRYRGNVPSDRAALESLPGVGRKTANIILSRVFNVPAIAVDTHVKRVSRRIFGIRSEDPDVIERVLMKKLPERVWNDVNLTIIFHGRAICSPRKPACLDCPVNKYCEYYKRSVQ